MKDGIKTSLELGGGLLVGGISGFFGGGGGMLCVPLLQLAGLDVKRAHATALLVILPICIVCAAIYIYNGYFDLRAVACACIGVVSGGAAGALLLRKLDSSFVAVLFAALMIAIGIKLMIK